MNSIDLGAGAITCMEGRDNYGCIMNMNYFLKKNNNYATKNGHLCI